MKNWRREKARAQGVPDFLVASARALQGIASTAPTNPDALLAVPGIGPVKLERYGDEILSVVEEHLRLHEPDREPGV